MTWEDTFRVTIAALFSVASAGAIITALASWLGKIWADRILTNETHRLQTNLANTQHQLDVSLNSLARELDLVKEVRSSVRNDKVQIYRGIIDLIAQLLGNLDAQEVGRLSAEEAAKQLDNLNYRRIQLYGYMAMFAPQGVIDAQDDLMDHLLLITQGSETYCWQTVRAKALILLNAVRKDVGVDHLDITYNGKL